jgi:hypothetical protein
LPPEPSAYINADLRTLYRKLARLYHPVHAKTPDQREANEAAMRRINAAYAAYDLHALQRLEAELPTRDGSFPGESASARIAWAVAQLVYELGPGGNQLGVVALTDYPGEKVRTLYPSGNALRAAWADPDHQSLVVEQLAEREIDRLDRLDGGQQGFGKAICASASACVPPFCTHLVRTQSLATRGTRPLVDEGSAPHGQV